MPLEDRRHYGGRTQNALGVEPIHQPAEGGDDDVWNGVFIDFHEMTFDPFQLL